MPYAEHYKEAGYNAIFFFDAAHSWARELRIVNADYGIGLERAHFCTVDDVQLSTDFKRDTMSAGVCSALPAAVPSGLRWLPGSLPVHRVPRPCLAT